VLIGLYHPLDGITNPKYKLLPFLTTNKKIFKEEKPLAFIQDRKKALAFIQDRKKVLAFYQDRCRDLELCLQLILLHFISFYGHRK
jgi:hypothetical protein